MIEPLKSGKALIPYNNYVPSMNHELSSVSKSLATLFTGF